MFKFKGKTDETKPEETGKKSDRLSLVDYLMSADNFITTGVGLFAAGATDSPFATVGAAIATMGILELYHNARKEATSAQNDSASRPTPAPETPSNKHTNG